jgi:predicted acyltransferase
MGALPLGRLVSLDQFRGYTVVGMLVVNYISHFNVAKSTVLAHHNTYCSYADTIMPQFFFAVGFAFRLVWQKTVDRVGLGAACQKILIRCFSLIVLGVAVYGTDFKFASMQQAADAFHHQGWLRVLASGFERNAFQTLVHIGVTSLFVLPVMGLCWRWRVGWMFAALVLHGLVSQQFYFEWVWNRPGIDGGPLGFLTWTVPLIVGSLACDGLVHSHFGRNTFVVHAGLWSVVLMTAGYAMSCRSMMFRTGPQNETISAFAEPPFVMPNVRNASTSIPDRTDSEYRMKPNYWMMSQRAGTPSYLVFSAGFSLLVFAVFVCACDSWGFHVPVFQTFGTNALAAYLLHPIVASTMEQISPADAPPWFVAASVLIYLVINWMFIHGLERAGVFIRL